jgi:hypothetical protein
MTSLTLTVVEAMRQIAAGTLPMKEGLASVAGAFGKLQEEAKAGVAGASQAMIVMIQQARALGLVVPEITAAVSAALSKSKDAMSAFFGKDGASKLLLSASDAGHLFAAQFWAEVAEYGVGVAVKNLSATWDAMMAQFGPAAMEKFGQIGQLMNLDPKLLDAIGQLQVMLDGLADSGYMTAGSFQAIENAAMAAYQKLIDGGATSEAALLAIRPLLIDLEKRAREYGYALDPATQELVDQAKAMGAFPTDPMDKIVNLLKQMVTLLGGIPDELDQATAGMNKYADATQRVKIPRGSDWAYRGETPTDGYATGGIVNAPLTGQRVTVHGQEAIVPLRDLFGSLANIIAAKLQPVQGGGQTVVVQMPDGSFVRAVERLQKRGELRTHPQSVVTF